MLFSPPTDPLKPMILALLLAATPLWGGCGGATSKADGGTSSVDGLADGAGSDGGLAGDGSVADAWQHPSPYLSPDGWRWETPLPFGKDFYGVWGSGESDIFAVGAEGFIAHFDGSAWAPMASPAQLALRGVWGASPSLVYAVGDGGTVLRYDGKTWTLVSVPTTEPLRGVWVSPEGHVVAVGGTALGGPLALHFDGQSWRVETPPLKWVQLTAVWGSAKDDVHALTTEPSSGQGSFLHFDGSTWTVIGKVSKDMTSLWGFAKDSIYATGGWDVVYRYDGTAWKSVKNGGLPNHRRAIFGSNATDLWLDGNSHFNGSSWSTSSTLYPPIPGRQANAGWAAPSGFTIVVGADGGIATQAAGQPAGSWRPSTQGPTLRAVAGLGQGAVIVGDEGTILRDDGRQQSPMASPVTSALYGVWSRNASEAYAVGSEGVILRYDGTSWTKEDSGVTAALAAVWGPASGAVYAVGQQVLLQRVGGSWKTVALPPAASNVSFGAIWGSAADDIYAAGSNHTLMHFDGSTWGIIDLGSTVPTSTFFHGIWGSGQNDVYVVGDLGVGDLYVLHFDGTGWVKQSENVFGQLEAVAGTANRVFAVGYSGTTGAPVMASKAPNEASWRADALVVPFDARLYGLWSDGKTQVIAVGDSGAILRKMLP